MIPYIYNSTRIYIKALPQDIEPLLAQCSPLIIEKINNSSSLRRKREIIASHLLIKEIFGEGVTITHDGNGAPLLNGAQGHISISHSATEIAVAVDMHHPIGIDIENWRDQLIKVKSRFLSQKEMEEYATPQLMLKAWTIKEAVYKVAQSPGISLADDIMLPLSSEENIAKANTHNGIKEFQIQEIISTPLRCITLAYPI